MPDRLLAALASRGDAVVMGSRLRRSLGFTLACATVTAGGCDASERGAAPAMPAASAAAVASVASDEPVFTFTGYGAITIGMTKPQVHAASHVPLAMYGSHRCTWLYDKRVADAGANQSRTPQITLDSRGVVRHIDVYLTVTGRTDRGVGGGSTRAEVLRAYPEPHKDVQSQAGNVLVISGPEHDLSFVFDDAGTVDGIAIGYRGYVLGFEDCSG